MADGCHTLHRGKERWLSVAEYKKFFFEEKQPFPRLLSGYQVRARGIREPRRCMRNDWYSERLDLFLLLSVQGMSSTIFSLLRQVD